MPVTDSYLPLAGPRALLQTERNPKDCWFSLVGFRLIRAVGIGLVAACLAAALTVTYAEGQSRKSPGINFKNAEGAASQTFSGVITDSTCGARHTKHPDLAPTGCVRACRRDGAAYVLVDGDNLYRLDGKIGELAEQAGQRVKVTGTLKGTTIQVTSISAP
jgi:hypothetical protein